MIISSKKLVGKEPFAEGGEGIVYLGQNGYTLYKKYKDTVNINEKHKKFKFLIDTDLPSNILKPIEEVLDEKNKFTGFIMNKVEGNELKLLTNKKFCKDNNVTLRTVISVLHKIATTLENIHNHGIVIGDINEKNFILDSSFEPYFIDVDSWQIAGCKTTACMETFKDPMIKNKTFTKETDYYAFAILCFKTIVRLHPFAGTDKDNTDVLIRMNQKRSVLCGEEIIVPKKIIRDWKILSPELLASFHKIFDTGERFLIKDELLDLMNNLGYCMKHQENYFAHYSTCPICNPNANIKKKIIKNQQIETVKAKISTTQIKEFNDCYKILDSNRYISSDGEIVHINSDTKELISKHNTQNIFFNKDGNITIVSQRDKIEVYKDGEKKEILKKEDSIIKIVENTLYFITEKNILSKLNLLHLNMAEENIKIKSLISGYLLVDFEANKMGEVFALYDYGRLKILNINGCFYMLEEEFEILKSKIAFDNVTKKWLLVLKTSPNKYSTYLFRKNILEYSTQRISYKTDISTIMFNQDTIYSPIKDAMKGLNIVKQKMKIFPVDGMKEHDLIIRKNNHFKIINPSGLYQLS